MTFRSDIQRKILQILPPDVGVSKVEFEGPSIAIYVLNPKLVVSNTSYIRQLAKEIKKHVIVRGDPSIRAAKDDASRIIKNIIDKNYNNTVDEIYFEDITGDVYIYLRRPVRGRVELERIIFAETGWRPRIVVTALDMTEKLPREEVEYVKQVHKLTAKERLEFLRNLGLRIHRDLTFKDAYVTVTVMGSGFEVGRSALLVRTKESSILLDCGIKPGAPYDEPPYLDQLDIDRLDAVIVTHAHLDHIGFIPYLYKYGYRGPVYMLEPTKYLMEILLSDYLEICEREGKPLPYGKQDVETALYHTITLEYEDVTDVAPDVKLTQYNAGHEVGSTIVHLHIGNGLFNIVYTGDFKYENTRLLSAATSKFRRVDLLIMEGTYGGKNDVQKPRSESERELIEVIRKTVEHNGKVLIPAFSTGRAQEILLVLNEAFERKELPRVPTYVDGMILETLNVHLMFHDYLIRNVRELIYQGVNPFLSENIIPVKRPKRPDKRYEQVMEIIQGQPCIIIAPHGMLNGGPVLDYFINMASDERNALILVSYQAENTVGRRILQGERRVTIRYYGEDVSVDVNMKVFNIPGFSGHSDRRQLISYVRSVEPRPQKIIVVHGERSKLFSLASTIEINFKIPVVLPENLDTIRLV